MSRYSDAVRADGAIGYWRLGDAVGSTTAIDVGGGHNGAVSSGVTFGQAGALSDGGKAALFNASFIEVVDTPTLNLTTAITLEAWVYPTSFTPSGPGGVDLSNIVEKTGSYFMTLEAGTGRLAFYVLGSHQYSVSSVTLNAWNHVATTYDGANLRWYINGVLDRTLAGTGALTADPRSVLIGGEGSDVSLGRHLNGRLQEVSIYPVAISTVRVAAHYALATKPQQTMGIAMPTTSQLPNRNKSNQTYGWWSSPNKRKY